MIMWTDFYQASSKRENLNGSLCSMAQLVTGKPLPTTYLERLKFTTNYKMISDFPPLPIPRVHKEQIVMKAWVNETLFLRVQVTVIVRWDCNHSLYIRLNPNCYFNSCCTSIGPNCFLLFIFPLSGETSWQIHLILMHCFEPKYSC